MQAKTVDLVNRTGKQAVLDDAYSAFQKWSRFTIVHDENADLRIVFSRSETGNGYVATAMEVFVRGETDAAFQTTVRVGGFLRDRSAKECVDDFRKRLQ